jgi:CubicO group peptidase (beta-lactamase class C family)
MAESAKIKLNYGVFLREDARISLSASTCLGRLTCAIAAHVWLTFGVSMRCPTLFGLILMCASLVAVAGEAAADDVCANGSDSLRTAQQAAFSASKLPGYCAIKIARGSTAAGALVAKASSSCFAGGLADISAPYSVNTRQPIGSVSKTFIGLALAQLSVEHKIDLDADINTYLPWPVRNPRFKTQPITLRQLATHTSSIRDRPAAYRKSYVAQAAGGDLAGYLKSYFVADGALFAADNFSRAVPGSSYDYSNIGAALAAYVIELKLAMHFERYVDESIVRVIGMQASFQPRATDAQLYKKSGAAISPYRLLSYPDGGLIASCSDLARYVTAVVDANAARPSVLSKAAVQLMLTPQFTSRPAKLPEKITNHGLFWEIRGDKIGHTGSDPGVTALLSFDPRKGTARLQLSNIDIEESSALTQQFIALWRLME